MLSAKLKGENIMFKGMKSILFKKKIYVYENSEGDKGIIIAYTEIEARRLFQEIYPKRKIVDNDDNYYDNGAYLYELGTLSDESKLYCAFPW